MLASVSSGRLAKGMKECTTYAFARSDGRRKKGVRAQDQGLARVNRKTSVQAEFNVVKIVREAKARSEFDLGSKQKVTKVQSLLWIQCISFLG